MSEHRTKIIVTVLAIILIIIALFSQRSLVKPKNNSLLVKEEKYYKLLDTSHLNTQNSQEEFFILEANPLDKKFLNISGVQIENKSGQKALIGNATENFLQASVNKESPIIISGKTKLIIASGKSPVGVSFKENMCSGFLNQYQTFVPPLEENCPSALSIIKKARVNISSSCEEFAETIPSCKIISEFPANIDSSCIETIKENVHYNGCVAVAKNSSTFPNDTYRIYLNLPSEFFKNIDDLIKIVDQSGKVVESKLLLKI